MKRNDFDIAQISELLQFAKTQGLAPYHPSSQLERFLKQFVSSPVRIIDIHSKNKRVAAAVLLDKIQNPGNSACLELLGIDRNGDPDEAIALILDETEKAFPKNRNGIEISYHDTHPFKVEKLTLRGYQFHYETYEMLATQVTRQKSDLPGGFQWEEVTEKSFGEYYSVLTQSFEKNLETSIPPIGEMLLTYRSKKIPALLLRDSETAIGSLNVNIIDGQARLGEIHTIGILPTHRLRKLGGVLLNKAIEVLKHHGTSQFKLTVAVANSNALKLYERFGFTAKDRYSVLRKEM